MRSVGRKAKKSDKSQGQQADLFDHVPQEPVPIEVERAALKQIRLLLLGILVICALGCLCVFHDGGDTCRFSPLVQSLSGDR